MVIFVPTGCNGQSGVPPKLVRLPREIPGGGGGGALGSILAGYVPLASQSPYPIIVYSVANYRPHLSHF